MKRIFTLIILLISINGFCQSDTIIQDSTTINYEFTILELVTDYKDDTISSAHLHFNRTRLAWSTNSSVSDDPWEKICDSVINIFDDDFETLLVDAGIGDYSDPGGSGDYTLARVTCIYDSLTISEVQVQYFKNEKAPNGVFLNNSRKVPLEILSPAATIPFTEFSEDTEIRDLYLGVYGKDIGNE